MSLVLTVIMVLSLAGCGKSTELSSVSRDPATDDGTVWFDGGSGTGGFCEKSRYE